MSSSFSNSSVCIMRLLSGDIAQCRSYEKNVRPSKPAMLCSWYSTSKSSSSSWTAWGETALIILLSLFSASQIFWQSATLAVLKFILKIFRIESATTHLYRSSRPGFRRTRLGSISRPRQEPERGLARDISTVMIDSLISPARAFRHSILQNLRFRLLEVDIF